MRAQCPGFGTEGAATHQLRALQVALGSETPAQPQLSGALLPLPQPRAAQEQPQKRRLREQPAAREGLQLPAPALLWQQAVQFDLPTPPRVK